MSAMEAKIGYILYEDGYAPEFFTIYPEYKWHQGKIVKIVYFILEDDN
jgi:hypothetical protein